MFLVSRFVQRDGECCGSSSDWYPASPLLLKSTHPHKFSTILPANVLCFESDPASFHDITDMITISSVETMKHILCLTFLIIVSFSSRL